MWYDLSWTKGRVENEPRIKQNDENLKFSKEMQNPYPRTCSGMKYKT